MNNNRFGLHWANVPIGEQLGKWALGMGGDCYLVMDGGHGWIPKIREARPNAVIVQRHAVSNWMNMSPADWAGEMADLFRGHKEWTRHVELECEPDIFPNFPGWGQPIVDRLKFAAEWNIEVAKRLRELCPGVIIHSAPLAHERIDLPQWFKIWKPLMDVCDVLDMHCYWEKDGKYYKAGLYDPEESYHRAFRYRKIHDFLESQSYHIPMMVTECGSFAPDLPEYDTELIYYFFGLEEDAAYMIGGCVFILKSNIHNWVNNLTRQPNIERFFRALGDALKESLPYPKREPKEEEEMVDSPLASWRKGVPLGNYSEGPTEKTEIVLHSTGGSFTSAVNWFLNPESGFAAQYVIGRGHAGVPKIYQMVKESDIGHHAGEWEVNTKSIGIECADDNLDHLTAPQRDRLIALCKDIVARNPIERIRLHREIVATRCPQAITDVEGHQIAQEVLESTEANLLARIAELEAREEEMAKVRSDDKAGMTAARNILNDRIDKK